MMKIVADENIPLVEHYFGHSGELILKPGRQICSADVADADMLLVRSVTQVDKKLLQHSNVKFVGTATSGFDHLDIEWLTNANIVWSAARGCNARAVVEYVICSVAALQEKHFMQGLRAGVIGVGHIGHQVVAALQHLGMDVIQCDPLRAESEKDFVSTPIEEFSELDFISLHLPLTKTGRYPTYHLIDEDFLRRQKKNCALLNAGRGDVIDSNHLKLYGQHLLWCLDVWEGEPYVDIEVVGSATIATPHIAGYSIHGKYRGAQMLYEAAVRSGFITRSLAGNVDYPMRQIDFQQQKLTWQDVVLEIFNPLVMTVTMKEALLEDPDYFDKLRKKFVNRYEFEFVQMQHVQLSEEDREILQRVGCNRILPS